MFKLSRDLGIDLGTANVLVYVEGKGIVLREPSVVAIDKNSGKVLQVGSAARNMLGRTPGNVVAVRPLREGVISDYEMTEKMLSEFLKKIIRYSLIKPRVVVCVPSNITEVEERAVIQATMEAGARRVYLIEEPFAAALGAGLDLSAPNGYMVVDIGGGTTDIAVLSLNDIAVSTSTTIAGDTFDEAIVTYIRRRHGLVIGTTTAEEIKITIGCVTERPEEVSMTVKGRDVKTGCPGISWSPPRRCSSFSPVRRGSLWTRFSMCWSWPAPSLWAISPRTALCSPAAAASSGAWIASSMIGQRFPAWWPTTPKAAPPLAAARASSGSTACRRAPSTSPAGSL